MVFQTLPHTLGLPAATWRVLAKCHERRNLAEYEGALDIDERLLSELLDATQKLSAAIRGALCLPGHND